MPQVASNQKVQAHNHQLPRLARPAQQPDRAPSPFETLLDDSAQAPNESAPPPPDDKTPRAANAQPARPAAKSNDSKAPVVNDNSVTTKPDDSGAAETDDPEKALSDVEAAVNAKITEASPDEVITEPVNDDKPADGQKADSPAIDFPDVNVQVTTTDSVSVAAVPTPAVPAPHDQAEHIVQLPEQAARAAEVATQSKPPDPALLKAVVGKPADAGKQADGKKPADTGEQADTDQIADESTDGPKLTGKPAPQPHTDGKDQPAPSEGDKQHIAQARGEIAANRHASPDAPASFATDQGAAAVKSAANSAPPAIVSTQSHAAANAATPAILISQPGPQAAAIPLTGVAIEIAGKALAGKNRFEIRLDPPELGRIEVRLDVDRDGNVTSRLTVDRADTLDLLRRDAAGLERALQDAGLKTANNGLQFSLRDQSMNQQQASGGPDTAQILVSEDSSVEATPQNYGRHAWQGNGVDIRV